MTLRKDPYLRGLKKRFAKKGHFRKWEIEVTWEGFVKLLGTSDQSF